MPLLLGAFQARLAHLKLLEGDVEEAVALAQENLRNRWERGDRWGVAESLSTLAWASVRLGAADRATVFLAAAESLWTATSGALFHQYTDEEKRARQAALDALGQQAFAEAWATGQRLALQEVVAQALAPLELASE
jgi:hypothetical protein